MNTSLEAPVATDLQQSLMVSPPPAPSTEVLETLPRTVAAALWRGDQLGRPVSKTIATGFSALDGELPGGGWPANALTEILQPQTTVAEWRLLAPAMRTVVTHGGQLVIIGPPKQPHMPGLHSLGIEEKQFVWIQADTPAQLLWSTEQIIKSDAAGLTVAWLPQARPEQIRRLQVCAQSCSGPVFLCRPMAAMHEASAAPLRVLLRVGVDWELHLQILKRKGPTREDMIRLPSIPSNLELLLTPRLLQPSALLTSRQEPGVVVPHAVGRISSRTSVRSTATH